MTQKVKNNNVKEKGAWWSTYTQWYKFLKWDVRVIIKRLLLKGYKYTPFCTFKIKFFNREE